MQADDESVPAGLSPFLAVSEAEWVASNELAFALRDRFPVSPGHTLVITRRLVATWFEAEVAEQHAVLRLVDDVKRQLDEGRPRPDGYNVGFDAGVAAGQTVMHLHLHVIPRFAGDPRDAHSGVRNVGAWPQTYASLPPRPEQAGPFALLPTFVPGDSVHFEESLRKALLAADRIDLLAAFVQTSGLGRLLGDLRDALSRGASIRLLTGDYLGITSADALRQLLGISNEYSGFMPYLFEVSSGRAFHPKAYLFRSGDHGVAYVGSSNLSASALTDGIEWNLRLVRSDDVATFADIADRFDALVASPQTAPLTRELIEAYERRAPESLPPAPEVRAQLPSPTTIQIEALAALKAARREGKSRGLVVLATGLGKTFLSAFDFKQLGGERALFVAHREEILDQARDSWQSVFPDKVVGSYRGDRREQDADIVFASIQTLARATHLARFGAQHFDYIVVDEFHHAAAATYRKVLGHFSPRFLLGLTATPERMDGKSLLELCGENLIFRRNLVYGITQKLLVPFRYFAVKDSVNFEPIPWRAGRFDAADLTAAVATEGHAAQALAEYERRALAREGARRTICFCCTVEHADFMADFLRRNGKSAAAVHSGPASAPRAESLRSLKRGELEIICAVDVFNEGLDVPDINTVIMLRPTESPVVFLQQMGRGLRLAYGKEALVIVDFIGNHRSFLSKPQSLLFLLGQELPPRVALERLRAGTLDLPPGCSVEIDTEALDLLAAMVRVSQDDIAVYEYVTFRDAHGRRPTAGELFRDKGVGFKAIRDRYESWFDFVASQGDLLDKEARVLQRHARWFHDLLCMRILKSYKMLSLRALIDADRLFIGMDIEENARRALSAARSDLMMFRELSADEFPGVSGAAVTRRWRDEAINLWARGESTSSPWFRVEGDSLVPTFDVAPEDRVEFETMTEEMVDLRLVEHRDRLLRKLALDATQAPILLTVSHSNRRPILRFDRARRPDIPEGATPVEVARETLMLDFKKIAVNVASRDGSLANVLPESLRALFGPATGQPGIRHRAWLTRDDEGRWRLSKDHATPAVVDAASVLPMTRVAYYRDLQVACGTIDGSVQQDETVDAIEVQIAHPPVDPAKHFVVRASGDSMNGGDTPIADGDLLLCEWSRSASAESVEGRPHLLVGHDSVDSTFAVLKVPRKVRGGWELDSWNPDVPMQSVPPTVRLEPVARFVCVIQESSGLVLYGQYDRDAIAPIFGSKNDPSFKVGHRDLEVGGARHTILMITLRKAAQTKVEHRYADLFLSDRELQWESQASTAAESLKGRRLRGLIDAPRTIHLFVQYESHQKFTYLGPVTYVSHEGEKPMRVRFALQQPLPEPLWKMWG